MNGRMSPRNHGRLYQLVKRKELEVNIKAPVGFLPRDKQRYDLDVIKVENVLDVFAYPEAENFAET